MSGAVGVAPEREEDETRQELEGEKAQVAGC